jgi:hypothetical protein
MRLPPGNGQKAYATRVDFEMDGILNTDTYYNYGRCISSLRGRPDLAGTSTQWKEHISGEKTVCSAIKPAGFSGITTDLKASIITKESNILAAA